LYQEIVPVLAEDVFAILGDKQSVEILNASSTGLQSSSNGIGNQTKKQYYIRTKQLLKAGLVQRDKGRFSLTCLGAVVYHAQLVVEAGVNNYWKLKAIDSITSSGEIGEQERTKLIKTIIDNNTIESILVAQR